MTAHRVGGHARRRAAPDAEAELRRLARDGTRAARDVERLALATDAFAHDRDREAVGILERLRDRYPDAAAVRELLGLAYYRLGRFAAATEELDAFREISRTFDQHPVLMDCARAQRRWARVDELWEELAAASPSAALVDEGRIVLAGSLADRGRLDAAIATLDRRAAKVRRVQDHHLRVWYALADLEERAGNLPRARTLFRRIHDHDAEFFDVRERLAALG